MIRIKSAADKLLLVFLVCVSIALIFPQLINRPVHIPDQNYPYVILETIANPEEVLNLLSVMGEGIIWRGNALVPLSRVGSVSEVELSSISSRLEPDDMRRNPGLTELLHQFSGAEANSSLLYIPREWSIRSMEPLLVPLADQVYFHIDRGLPPYFGAGLWLIIFLVFLGFAEHRSWTALVAVMLLPMFFVPNPLYLSLSCIAFVVLREISWRVFQSYCRSVQDEAEGEAGLVFPSNPRGLVHLLYNHAQIAAPFRLLWLAFVLSGLIVAVILGGPPLALLALLQIPLLTVIVLLRMHLFLMFSRDQEHTLFFASGLTPAWEKPHRAERAALWFLVIVVVIVPFLFRINYSPFPSKFMRPEQTGQAMVAEEFAGLHREVLALLELRVLRGEGVKTEAVLPETSPQAYSRELVSLLADRAYQQAFPYISLSGTEGAGRYEEGQVHLTRFRFSEDRLESYEETVLDFNEDWLLSALEGGSEYDMLRLYSDGESWYDIRPETGVRILPRLWSLIPEMFIIVFLSLPWLGRWQFEPLQRLAEAFRKTGKRGSS